MIKKFIIVCALFCQCLNLSGQFLDDFSDSDLNSNPSWEGNLQDFIVNSEERLQLNAGETTQSRLFTQLNFADSIQWEFETLLDFSPSANNRLRIYLALDQVNIETASGYFFEIGENGAVDALNFYFLNQGVPELLASGSMGTVNSEPAYLKCVATFFPGGEWLISTSYMANSPLEEELDLIHDAYDFSGNQIFLIECNYTSSRSDKFSFDNIGIKKFELDKVGPEILSASLVNASSILIQANEKLNSSSISNIGNYILTPFSGSISSARLENNETAILLQLSEPLTSGVTYSLQVSNIEDILGNSGLSANFDLFLIDEASAGDLVVNEILFNPETGGSDFVEILNVSDKFIFLGNLSIQNADKNESKLIGSDLTILPGQHLCLTEDIEYLKDRYLPPDTALFLSTDLPSFNNDEGNVSIVNSINSEIIDSYDYNEDQHFSQLEDLNGVSLERISPFSDKWFSASAAVNFASPGYRNSVYLNEQVGNEETMAFANKTFSPNQDGVDDQLIINYKLPSNGYLVDILIFDQYGRLIRNLVNNELLPEEGFVLWDGLDNSNEVLGIGIYFVVLEAYNDRGNDIKSKKAAILADFFD